MKCPKCGKEAEAEFEDVGFGKKIGMQVGPYHCVCGWVDDSCQYKSPDACKRCTSEHICRPAGLCADEVKQ